MTEQEMELIRRERDDLLKASRRAAVAFRMRDGLAQVTAMRCLTTLVDSINDRDVSGLRQIDLEEVAAA